MQEKIKMVLEKYSNKLESELNNFEFIDKANGFKFVFSPYDNYLIGYFYDNLYGDISLSFEFLEKEAFSKDLNKLDREKNVEIGDASSYTNKDEYYDKLDEYDEIKLKCLREWLTNYIQLFSTLDVSFSVNDTIFWVNLKTNEKFKIN